MSLFHRPRLPKIRDIMEGQKPLSIVRVTVNYREYRLGNTNDPGEIGDFLTRCAELYAMGKPIGHEFKVHVVVSQTPQREFDRLDVPFWAHTTDEIRYDRFSEFSDWQGGTFFITYHYCKVAHPGPRRR